MIYKEHIESESLKDKYSKTDLLKNNYLMQVENGIEMFYAPIDYINIDAIIIIIGITPGWSQMERAFRTTINSLYENKSWTESIITAKIDASFAGSMRNNLVKMLDDLGVNRKLNVPSTSEFFNLNYKFLHSTSLLKYPVFSSNKNYNGNNPSPISSPMMWDFIKLNFVPEINSFKNKLIIPLGKCVSEVIKQLNSEGLLNENTYLLNFPHPSGANGHRIKQFERYRESMCVQIKKCFL